MNTGIVYSNGKRVKQELEELERSENCSLIKKLIITSFSLMSWKKQALKKMNWRKSDAELKMLSNSEGIKSALIKSVF